MKKVYILLFVGSILMMQSCSDNDDNGSRQCPDATCNNYSTQTQAQTAFDADPACMQALDDDKDGIACEHLTNNGVSTGGSGTGGTGSGGSNCPTTANCGCSNKNKDQCGGSCCQWIVGTGCRCR